MASAGAASGTRISKAVPSATFTEACEATFPERVTRPSANKAFTRSRDKPKASAKALPSRCPPAATVPEMIVSAAPIRQDMGRVRHRGKGNASGMDLARTCELAELPAVSYLLSQGASHGPVFGSRCQDQPLPPDRRSAGGRRRGDRTRQRARRPPRAGKPTREAVGWGAQGQDRARWRR